jgi:glucosyl-3-phosphoglycerate phosphatase
MSQNRRIVLWRHGRTEWNALRKFQGQQDIPLDDVGQQQARDAAAKLALLSPSRIISSDLKRAFVTAQALAEATGVDVVPDPNLRETFAGDWEGRTREYLVENHGDACAPAAVRLEPRWRLA